MRDAEGRRLRPGVPARQVRRARPLPASIGCATLVFLRLKEQTRGTETRTVGTYEVYHDGKRAAAITVDGVLVPLSGATAESRGPGQNTRPATAANLPAAAGG